MPSKDWNYGVLRENFGPLPVGTEVFYRRMTSSRPLAVGPSWWVRPRHTERFFCVAESFGGEQMSGLIHMKRNSGVPIRSSGDATIRLNRELRDFQSRLPEGARVSTRSLSINSLKSNLFPKESS